MEGRGAETARKPGQAVKKSRWALWLGGAAVALAVLVAAGLLASRALKISKARNDVQILALALDGFARENGDYPRGSLAEVCAMLRGESVRGQNPLRLDYIEARPEEMNAAGEFVDPWGMTYRIVVEPTVVVYSCGPNRVDEQGVGDDIVGQ